VHTGDDQEAKAAERLTGKPKPRTIPPMTRDVLQAILRASEGTSEKGGTYRVQPETRVTFYLGSEGRGMTVNEVEGLSLADTFVSLVTKENGTVYVDYAAIFAVAVKPAKNNAPPRAGFA
jgi:hypothetical protein